MKKKFYVLLMTAAFATTSFAQSPTKGLAVKADPDQPLITEQPAGTLYANYYGESAGHGSFYEGEDGKIEHFVVNDNGEVYLKDAVSSRLSNSWIKGQKTVGDTIVFQFPQKYCIEQEKDYMYRPVGDPYPLYVWRMVKRGNDSWVVDETSQTVKYVMRNDSLFRVDDYKTGVYLGLGKEDGTWTKYCDFYNIWTKVNDPLVQLPQGVTPESYNLAYSGMFGNEDSRIIQVAIDGNDFYMGNLAKQVPGAWVKGKIEGGKVVFAGKTYLGACPDWNYHYYFSPMGYTRVKKGYFEEDSLYFVNELTFDYDASTKECWLDEKPNVLLGVNTGKNRINEPQLFYEPTIAPWQGKVGAPLNPDIYAFTPYDVQLGYGKMEVAFTEIIPDDSEDDYTPLDLAKLFYRIYFDDKLHVFTPDLYDVKESMSDIPYTFHNGKDIRGTDYIRSIRFRASGFKKVSIQFFLKDKDKVYSSDYVSYTVGEDGKLTDDISPASVSEESKRVLSVSYTDLSGRNVSNPMRGLYLKTVSYADGSRRTTKVVNR